MDRVRVEAVVETLATLGRESETIAEVAHDARNMVTALCLYCDLLEEPGVLAPDFLHYGSELRLIAAASHRLVQKLVALDTDAAHRDGAIQDASQSGSTLFQPALDWFEARPRIAAKPSQSQQPLEPLKSSDSKSEASGVDTRFPDQLSMAGTGQAGMSRTGMSQTGMSQSEMSLTGISQTGTGKTGMSQTGMSQHRAGWDAMAVATQESPDRPVPIATWPRWSRRAPFARTFSIASTSSTCACPLCATGARISRCWRLTFWTASAASTASSSR